MMSDTAPRNPLAAPRLLADALLRTAGGTTALLRIAQASAGGAMAEVGLVATTFSDVPISPVVLRKALLRESSEPKRELLISATAVEQQVHALNLASAEALFSMTMAVTVNGQEYLIESIAANEAFSQTYVYRLLLHESLQESL